MNSGDIFFAANCALVCVGFFYPRARLIRVRERFVETETFNPFRWLLLRSARQRWITQLLSDGYPMTTSTVSTETNDRVGLYAWRGVHRAVLSVGEISEARRVALRDLKC
jgi:hypothetical protein